MLKKTFLIIYCFVMIIACEKEDKYSFTDVPYLYGLVYPDSNPQWPFMFHLGYIRHNADNAYNSYPYKHIRNAEVKMFWNYDSISLTMFGDEEAVDYRDINLWAKPLPGDFLSLKATIDSKVLMWNGYLPVTKPQCVNLPQDGDTIDIQITERINNYQGLNGWVKDKGEIKVELEPVLSKKLKRFGFWIDNGYHNPFSCDYYSFKDSISMPIFVDTNDLFIKLIIGYHHIDSSIAAAFLLDGYMGVDEEYRVLDDDLKLYLKDAKKLSFRERSNIQGDGVGLIFNMSGSSRRLTGRIRR